MVTNCLLVALSWTETIIINFKKLMGDKTMKNHRKSYKNNYKQQHTYKNVKLKLKSYLYIQFLPCVLKDVQFTKMNAWIIFQRNGKKFMIYKLINETKTLKQIFKFKSIYFSSSECIHNIPLFYYRFVHTHTLYIYTQTRSHSVNWIRYYLYKKL